MSLSTQCDPVVRRELPMVRQIQADERWLEGERRGYCVPVDDPTVSDSVCLIILRIGAQMRAAIRSDIRRERRPRTAQSRSSATARTQREFESSSNVQVPAG